MANCMKVLDSDLKECYKHDLDWTLLPSELLEVSFTFTVASFLQVFRLKKSLLTKDSW